jgi:hypothetical protein
MLKKIHLRGGFVEQKLVHSCSCGVTKLSNSGDMILVTLCCAT